MTPSLELCNTLGKMQASAIGSLGGVNSDNPAPVAGAVYKATILTVDFFGKLVNAARYRMSVYYNMGTLMEVPPSAADLARAVAAYDAANSLE